MSNHKSFTLIELLVVISIIGVLSAIVMTSISSASSKARDSQRISEINQMRNVFEQYFYDDNFHYPVDDTGGSGFCMKDNSSFLASLSEYAPLIPEDPKGGDWPCYRYYSDSEGTGYILTAELESNSSQMQGDGGKSNDLYEVYDDTGYIEDYVEGGGGGYFPSSWLIGWDKRIEFTIDKDEVDTTLSNFPTTLILSSSSGIDNDDVTSVFDEISSNSLKLAVTTSDGENECYVEVAHWSDGDEEAELHVKVPSISSSSNTTLYLYYDNDHANNTEYVGLTNSVPAETVWDANFKAVYHMSDGADNAHIYDSTSNDNDGTKKGANEPNEVAGSVGKAQDFDEDYINCGNNVRPVSAISVEVLATPHAFDYNGCIIGTGRNGGALSFYPTGTDIRFYVYTTTWRYLEIAQADVSLNEPHYFAHTYDQTDLIAFLEGIQKDIGHYSGDITYDGKPCEIGGYPSSGSPYNPVPAETFDGVIGEVRISNIARSAGWIATTNSGLTDVLITYENEETF